MERIDIASLGEAMIESDQARADDPRAPLTRTAGAERLLASRS